MTKITWPTVEGYDLEVDANAQERTVRLRYTDPANARTLAVVFTHDRDAKAYTTGVAMTSPRNAIHLGPHGAETHPTGRHTARQLLTYVQDQVESGWLAETVNELTEHALEILPERLEPADDTDDYDYYDDEAAHLDELIAEAGRELATHNFPEGSEDSHMTPEMLVYGRMLTALNEAEAEAAESTEPCEDFDDCLLVDVCDGCTYDEDEDDFDYYDDDLDYYDHIYADEDWSEHPDGAPVCEETLAELDEELGNAEDRLADVVNVDARTFRHYRETIRKAARITDPGSRRRLEIDATLALLRAAEYGPDLH